ncbi:MAG: DUF423 domain-containing protein, partial [Planctomycetales bacterium]|nr:DUF423 domain-containing protein [Planctomycetales bacterium]
MNPRQTLLCATLAGALFVAIGALGAHFVPSYLERQGLATDVIAKRVHNLEVGVRYHAYHALALLGVSLWMMQVGKPSCSVGVLFMVGLLL